MDADLTGTPESLLGGGGRWLQGRQPVSRGDGVVVELGHAGDLHLFLH